MRKIRPASEETRETVAQAIEHLRQARTLLRESGAPRAAEAARHALRSAQGAARHADHRFRRSLP
ncbi:hypothetical protein [Sphingobium algorifonticola]|jgi:hypothetical protein|uniref:Uncharacterized protein n=1 Tax=Sphingobium algorifonticola TaxID=2008318 RepID=A0A437J3W8_9SPHN|nr:hypothetical protein [Sphingobium algorifonticola]RVT39195.1 hypothetical protein ENE74_16005 [Sphingobium algorifonticola]